MSSGWNTVEIGSVCKAIYDGPHATPKKTDSGPIFLGISNLQNGKINLTDVEYLSDEDFVRWTRRVTPNPGDIVFSYETKLGEAAIVPAGLKFCLGRRMALMRPDPTKVDPRFLLYAYLGPEFQRTLKAHTVHGSTVDRIPLIEFPRFPISLPSLPEQRAIARILGALDDKIDINGQMNATLEEIVRAFFQAWFVEGDDAEAWQPAPLGDIAENVRRGVQPANLDPHMPYIGLEHMPRERLALPNWGAADDVTSNKFLFKRNEFLFGKLRPYFRKVGVAPIDGVSSTDILVVAPKDDDYYGVVLGYISSPALIDFTTAASTGTKMPRTNWQDIAAYQIPMPPRSRAKEFTDLVKPMIELIRANIMESRTVAELRDTLLLKLMTVEVRVKDAEGGQ